MQIEQVTSRLHFVTTPHVNWVIYDGVDGTVLIDSGYLGQRTELEESLRRLGRGPTDLAAVLVTHAHADHIGGASWLATEFGVPVFGLHQEVPHLHRERVEQVGSADVVRNILRPGVLGWATEILPLVEGEPQLAVPSATTLPTRHDGAADVPGRPRAIAAPGHTSGNTMFHFAEEGVVIVGDTLVTGHRTSRRRGPQMLLPMFHHSVPLSQRSLQRLSELDADLLLPGHGPKWRGQPSEAVLQALRR